MLALVAVVLSVSGPWTCDREDARVTRHLEDALIQLRTVTPSGLSEAQRARRAEVLGLLRRYIDERQFPRSSGPTGPVFVDDDGRHCAMGALISWTGGAEMVEHIRATRNLATVPTLADEPGLVDWLTAHGLAPEEAALVQPSYFECKPTLELCRVGLRDGYELEVANGGPLPDGGTALFRVARTNGTRTRCAGDMAGPTTPYAWTPEDLGTDRWPTGAQIILYRDLLRTTRGLTPLAWARCPGAPTFPDELLAAPTFEACAQAMLAAEPRALIPMCSYWAVGYATHTEYCDASGRLRADWLPAPADARLLVEEWLARNRIDAGVLGTALDGVEGLTAEAWAHSDDGGVPLMGPLPEPVIWDGGVDLVCMGLVDAGIPESPVDDRVVTARRVETGCQAAPSELAWAALLVASWVLSGRRRVRPSGR